jgi:hypothetical protein
MTQRETSKSLAISVFILLLLGSLFLAYERLGLLPWISVLLSGVGLALMTVLTGRRSLYCLVLISGLVGFSWAGSTYYVFSTWESGEVVEIQLEDGVIIRTWVVESDGKEIVIYDCPPEYQTLVEASNLVSFNRGNKRYNADLLAVPAEELSSDEADNIYAMYLEKYPDQSSATDVYYLLIGPRRGSQIYVLYLTRRDA